MRSWVQLTNAMRNISSPTEIDCPWFSNNVLFLTATYGEMRHFCTFLYLWRTSGMCILQWRKARRQCSYCDLTYWRNQNNMLWKLHDTSFRSRPEMRGGRATWNVNKFFKFSVWPCAKFSLSRFGMFWWREESCYSGHYTIRPKTLAFIDNWTCLSVLQKW